MRDPVVLHLRLSHSSIVHMSSRAPARDLAFFATHEEKISRLRLEMTSPTRSQAREERSKPADQQIVKYAIVVVGITSSGGTLNGNNGSAQ